MVLISRMEERCGGGLGKPEMGGFRSWTDLPRGFEGGPGGEYKAEWLEMPPTSGFPLPIVNQNSGDLSAGMTGSPGASYSSGTSYETTAVDPSLSSYLLDGNVRAMLKKVMVNEESLNQTIQSLGGGEKGLKQLMGYIMLWVKEHKGENFSLSQIVEPPPPPPTLGSYRTSSDAALDLNQFYHRAKSRRLTTDDAEVDSRGMISGMPRELDIPQPSLFFASGGYDSAMTATTRAARRNRIVRQRQQTPRTPSSANTGCGLWSVPPPPPAPPTLDMRFQQVNPPNSGRKVYNLDMLTFLLQKELRPSDVGNLGRIILPKKEAEMHLPILPLREGVSLQMEDFDSGYSWTIRYRFWPNNKSRMYLLENTGEFVKSHHLEEGDRLILYRNQQGNYVLRGKKVHFESRGAQQDNKSKNHAHSLARGFPEAPVLKERDFGLEFETASAAPLAAAVKAEPVHLVGDDDPFFKEDVMHNIDSSFVAGLIQPLERFPSLNLDFPLDEIIVEDHVTVVPKTEPAG